VGAQRLLPPAPGVDLPEAGEQRWGARAQQAALLPNTSRGAGSGAADLPRASLCYSHPPVSFGPASQLP